MVSTHLLDCWAEAASAGAVHRAAELETLLRAAQPDPDELAEQHAVRALGLVPETSPREIIVHIAAARRLGSLDAMLRADLDAREGVARCLLGDLETARQSYRRAAAGHEYVGDLQSAAVCRYQLALLTDQQGLDSEASAAYRAGLVLISRATDLDPPPLLEEGLQIYLGRLLLRQGEVAQAWPLLSRAVAALRERLASSDLLFPDNPGAVSVVDELLRDGTAGLAATGMVLGPAVRESDPALAYACFAVVVDWFRGTGDTASLASALGNLGGLASMVSADLPARQPLQEAAVLFGRIDRPEQRAAALVLLARVVAPEDAAEAEVLVAEALPHLRGGQRLEAAAALQLIASLAQLRGDAEQSARCLHAAADLLPDDVTVTAISLVSTALQETDLPTKLQRLRQARDAVVRSADPFLVASVELSLAVASSDAGESALAMQQADRAIAALPSGRTRDVLTATADLHRGALAAQRGQLDQAILWLESSRRSLLRLGVRQTAGRVAVVVGSMELRRGRPREALGKLVPAALALDLLRFTLPSAAQRAQLAEVVAWSMTQACAAAAEVGDAELLTELILTTQASGLPEVTGPTPEIAHLVSDCLVMVSSTDGPTADARGQAPVPVASSGVADESAIRLTAPARLVTPWAGLALVLYLDEAKKYGDLPPTDAVVALRIG